MAKSLKFPYEKEHKCGHLQTQFFYSTFSYYPYHLEVITSNIHQTWCFGVDLPTGNEDNPTQKCCQTSLYV